MRQTPLTAINRLSIMKDAQSISIVIPTLNRGKVLLETIEYLFELDAAVEVIVVDQTLRHLPKVAKQLLQLEEERRIDLIRLSQPSVVAAMNVGLTKASGDYVLFLDDDIKPIEGLIENYQKLIGSKEFGIVAGRVIQPWNDPEGDADNQAEQFSFNALNESSAPYFIGANVLVNRRVATQLGGFDENFVGTAHDYEREFSDRVLDAGHSIGYCGPAAVYHLKEQSGGIRTYGHFLKTMKPHHAVGAYYYILRSKRVKNKPIEILRRLRQRVVTRTHLKQPWWIPLTLIGDLLGIGWACKLYLNGPKLNQG